MLGLFGLFGRSPQLKALDHALRAAGLHPRTVPDAVKLTTVRLVGEAGAGATPDQAALDEAARLLAFCILGHDQFLASNGPDAARDAERRLDAAIGAGDGLDARLVLLALHAGIIAGSVADRFEVDTD